MEVIPTSNTLRRLEDVVMQDIAEPQVRLPSLSSGAPYRAPHLRSSMAPKKSLAERLEDVDMGEGPSSHHVYPTAISQSHLDLEAELFGENREEGRLPEASLTLSGTSGSIGIRVFAFECRCIDAPTRTRAVRQDEYLAQRSRGDKKIRNGSETHRVGVCE